MLSLKTTIHVCKICGVQEYERSLFGTTIEIFSEREVDELGSYKKWEEQHGTTCNHQWIEIDEYGTKIKK